MKMKNKDILWLAGLLEGEAGFSTKVCKDKRRAKNKIYVYETPNIQLHLTDKDIVKRASKLFLSPLHGPYEPHGSFVAKKQVYATNITGSKAAGIMMTIYELLGKRRQSQIRKIINKWLE